MPAAETTPGQRVGTEVAHLACSDAETPTIDREPPAEGVEPDDEERRRRVRRHGEVIDGRKVGQCVAPASEQPKPAMVCEDAAGVQGKSSQVGARRHLEAPEDPAGLLRLDVEHRGRRSLLHQNGDRRPGWILDVDELFDGSQVHSLILARDDGPRGHLAVRSQETTRFLLDKYVIPEIGAYPISGISAADVERVMSALTARGLATATRRRALSMMRLVFDYAIRDRRLSVNVARMVALPRGGTKREPHWLRPEQLGRLVMAVLPLCQPVVLFLGTTGCRFSEMAALRVDDVVQTPHGLGVRVHRAATQSKRTSGAVFGPTKTHQTRTVPVPAALDEYVRTRVAFTAPGGYLFPSPTGGVWTNTNFRARSGWMAATRRAGVEGTTIHDLRHTAASLLIAAGADVKAVQVILGHSTATMTMDLYGHLFSEATWQAMERLPVIPLMRAPRAIQGPPPLRNTTF